MSPCRLLVVEEACPLAFVPNMHFASSCYCYQGNLFLYDTLFGSSSSLQSNSVFFSYRFNTSFQPVNSIFLSQHSSNKLQFQPSEQCVNRGNNHILSAGVLSQ